MSPLTLLTVLAVGLALAQGQPSSPSDEQPSATREPLPSSGPPHSSSRGPNDSSSKDNAIDLSPPAADTIEHPEESSSAPGGVIEMRSWDPHKADKNVEIGDYYRKRKNYNAAISRYCEALHWKSNDAIATYRLAESLESAGDLAGARQYYEAYLKILPHGTFAGAAKKAVQRIDTASQHPSQHPPLKLGCRTSGESTAIRAGQDLPPTSPPAQSHR